MPQNGNGTLLRPRYFDRQQLVADDLNLGQQYFRARLRRHNRFLHGWGVVCGAVVQQADPGGNPWLMRVSEGYAVTPRGDEIYIPPRATIDIEASVLACLGTENECPDVHLARAMINPPGRDRRSDYNDEWVEVGLQDTRSLEGYVVEHTLNINTPSERLGVYYRFREPTVFAGGSLIRIHSGAADRHEDPPADRINRYVADPGELGNWRLNNSRERLRVLDPSGAVVDEQTFLPNSDLPIGAGTVYLVVCTREDLCQPQVAMPKACTPAGGSSDFARICESYQLRVICDLPVSHSQPTLTCDQLEAIVCDGGIPPCPPAASGMDANCVVLATIGINRTPISINNTLDRRTLLSESLLQAYLLCRCTPPPPPTVAPTPEPTSTPAPTSGPTIGPTAVPTFVTIAPTLIGPTFIEPTFILGTEIPPPVASHILVDGGGLGIPVDLGGLNVEAGRLLPVDDIHNVGPVRRDRLVAEGINNVLDFATRPAAELAEIMDVSEVQVAEMQLQARELMARETHG